MAQQGRHGFFVSFNEFTKEKKRRSFTRSDASIASSSSDESPSFRLGSTPRSILRAPGKLPFATGSDNLCLLSPASSSVFDLFTVFDRDDDGKITPRELEAVLRRLGSVDPAMKEEVALMVAEMDRDGDGCISLEEFGTIGSAFGPLAGAELREAFVVFDGDGDRKISPSS